MNSEVSLLRSHTPAPPFCRTSGARGRRRRATQRLKDRGASRFISDAPTATTTTTTTTTTTKTVPRPRHLGCAQAEQTLPASPEPSARHHNI